MYSSKQWMYAVLKCGNFPTVREDPRHRRMPGRRPSVDRDGNSFCLDSRLLRNIDLQDAIGVARLDRLSLRSDRQSNSAQERAGNSLDVFDAVAVRALARQSVGTNCQDA